MKYPARLLPLLCLALAAPVASAGPLQVQWTDPAGDTSSVGDLRKVQLNFDGVTGAWTAHWWADAANPFTGNVRFNLNLFDMALGNLGTAVAPQLSLSAMHDFGAGSALEYSYGGTAAYLANWHLGDPVSTGNGTNFYSGLVDLNAPGSRDILLTQATITGELPEPALPAALGLGLMFWVRQQRRKQR
ncbi:hypothetical protein [Pelomonas sp. SE-A7]|uniref:hypothetical protein n=1 Tax=Pelomonas sp. SE-A7 TaxID=3054953 RepID=UPI00259D1053|nr:hypothetical protein [Pelomonas sp. SE-A7]MDM4764747.1 hypothetical protein [Pelomonas sp. SE-A7]